MNILMSGAFGFMGSYLTPHLLNQDGHLGVITRRVPGTFEAIAKQIDCHVHDLSEPGDVPLARSYDCLMAQ